MLSKADCYDTASRYAFGAAGVFFVGLLLAIARFALHLDGTAADVTAIGQIISNVVGVAVLAWSFRWSHRADAMPWGS